MGKEEILVTPIGEMLDMISCLAIYEGSAKQKPPKLSMEEILKLE